MRRYEVVRADAVDRDFDATYEFLVKSYIECGEDPDAAKDRAMARLRGIHAAMLSLGNAPHRGTLHPDLRPGLRTVTMDRAISYFTVDDDRHLVRVAAIFFGGQDHRTLMLKRLLSS